MDRKEDDEEKKRDFLSIFLISIEKIWIILAICGNILL